MKTSSDPRHQKRIDLMQRLFSFSFNSTIKDEKIGKILDKLKDIDEKLTKNAPEWPIEKISRIDLAILRLSIFELTIQKSEPPKVIIDEAVEMAKAFGNEHSPNFINGVLGSLYKGEINVI